MTKKCKFPNCHHVSKKEWALVDLCEDHYDDIKKETHQFYHEKSPMFYLSEEERTSYHAIAHLVPWRKKKK
jgi:hypothetical protein